MVTRSHGHLLVLGGKRLCSKLLDDILVRLLENREVLEGEVSEIICRDRLAKPSALQIPDMRGYVQWHESSLDGRKSVVRERVS